MQLRALPALLLLAVLAAPAAGAGHAEFVPPTDFLQIHPDGDGSVMTNVGWDVGRYWWSNGTFLPVASWIEYAPHEPPPPPLHQGTIRVSYGGAPQFFASSAGDWLVLDNWTLHYDRNAHREEAVHAVNLFDGTRVPLMDRGLWDGTSNAQHVALVPDNMTHLSIYEWGDWATPRVLPLPPAQENTSRIPDGFALDSASRRLAMLGELPHHSMRLRFIDVPNATMGESADYAPPGNDDRVVDAAFSPDGTRLAVLTSQTGRFGQVFLLDPENPWQPNVIRFTAEARALAWMDETRIAATFVERGVREGSWTQSHVRILHAENLTVAREAAFPQFAINGGLAWMEGRLVIGTTLGLAIVSEDLELVLLSSPGRAPMFPRPEARAPTPDAPPAASPPTQPSEQAPAPADAPLPWWLPIAAALVAIAARTPSERTRTARPSSVTRAATAAPMPSKRTRTTRPSSVIRTATAARMPSHRRPR